MTITAYRPPEGVLDETDAGPQVARDRYPRILREVAAGDLAERRDRVQEAMAHAGACFRTEDGRDPFRVDPVPRLLAAEEWWHLERGLAQRASALDAFITDVYSERRIVAEGVVPEAVISTSRLYDERLRGLAVPGDAYLFVYGPDLVREPSGEFLLLEDNVRTPSGIAYLLAIREVLTGELGALLEQAAALDDELGPLARALRLAAPDGVDDPAVAVLTDGRGSPAFYEHCEIARRLGAPIVTLDEIEARDGELLHRGGDAAGRRIDVLYRRTDDAAFSDPEGGLTAVGSALREPVEAGRLGVANAFGAGIGDDKLTHAYVDRMIRFYLGEEPLLRSVRTFDLVDESERAEALERLEDLVVKERHRAGGIGVFVEPGEDAPDLDALRARIRNEPDTVIVQERVEISTHPTVADDGRLEPRRCDLRPFLFRAEDGWDAFPGGLTRFAGGPDLLVVNSTQGGGGKDTWVVTAEAPR